MPFHAPRIDIPKTDIWTALFERASKPFPDSQIIYSTPTLPSSPSEHYTFSALKQTATLFGRGLRATFSFAKGDVLALFSPNCIDTPAVTWGTHWAGGIVSPANPAYTVGELAHHLKDCRARVVVTNEGGLGKVREAVGVVENGNGKGKGKGNGNGNEGRSIEIVVFGQRGEGERTQMTVQEGNGVDWRDVLASGKGRKGERTKIDAEKDLAFLVYSSGTTGLPKGVMLTHLNVVSELFMLNSVEGDILRCDRDKVLSVLPYYHIYGLQCLIHLPCYAGITTIVMPTFDLPTFCRIIQDHKITYTYVAPPVILHLAKSPVVEKFDLRSLRIITCGAAPLSRDLIFKVNERLGTEVKQAYGLSETSPATHIQKHWLSAPGSNGPPLPNQTIKFVSPTTNLEVSPGEEGELWIAGPNVFMGYLRNPTATKECTTSDGFFKTGDIGYADEEGNMYITDRLKELIKYKGFQVAPAELEGVIAGCAIVADVGVIGIWDKQRESEVPVACVVLREGVEGNEERKKEVEAWVRERVAEYKWLRGGVRWVELVPKSPSGKILRRVLREIVAKDGGGELKAKL